MDSKPDLDLNIFNEIGTECFGKDGKPVIKDCDHLNRIIHSLRYYEALQNSDDTDKQRIFTDFVAAAYDHVLNDWIHFMKIHSHQIDDIHDELTSPDNPYGGGCKKGMDSCTLFHRHYDGDRRGKHTPDSNDEEDAVRAVFIGELFDRMHHFLYHLFDAGMRTKREEVELLTASQENKDDDEKEHLEDGRHVVVDKVFAAKRQTLSDRRNKLKAITDRYDETKNNKFNIGSTGNNQIDEKDDIGTQSAISRKSKSFMDAMFNFLVDIDYPWWSFTELSVFLFNQQYDSDAVAEDIGADGTPSNIINGIGSNEYSQELIRYVKDMKFSRIAFSTGITWFYWDAYRYKIPADPFAVMNPNDYGGYSGQELFVKKKYDNYKQELLEHISMEEYKTLVVFKVQQYMKSKAVQALCASMFAIQIYHYGIKKGEPIQSHHITSMVMYCDFTDYCSRYSATFRKREKWETIESAKSRNAEYYWQSRYFRETVEVFGAPESPRKRDDVEEGPFFCGVDRVMVIPSFCIRLCGPSSTSKQIEVAMNFATEQGIILQLDNTGHVFAKLLSLFDVSWLSNFADEDERIWCGGWMTIRVESVRIVSNNKNYQMVNHSLFVLDHMLSGGIVDKGDEENEKVLTLKKKEKNLLKMLLTKDSSQWHLDSYIIDTFEQYRRNKLQIKMIMDNFEMDWAQSISDILLDSDTECKYIISADIFKAFCFTDKFTINTIFRRDLKDISDFDLIHFAGNISHGKWKQIVIEDQKEKWISKWNKDGEKEKQIIQVYDEKGFDIYKDRGILRQQGDNIEWGDLMIISRK